MDIYCRHCGEPWDIDSLHDVDLPIEQANKLFRKNGCGVFGNEFNSDPNSKCTNEPHNPDTAMKAGSLYDVLGSDLDGAASMMEEF